MKQCIYCAPMYEVWYVQYVFYLAFKEFAIVRSSTGVIHISSSGPFKKKRI